jgi:hypothetical protein
MLFEEFNVVERFCNDVFGKIKLSPHGGTLVVTPQHFNNRLIVISGSNITDVELLGFEHESLPSNLFTSIEGDRDEVDIGDKEDNLDEFRSERLVFDLFLVISK